MENTTLTMEAATIVIFGASGDLTERLLFPAIHRLMATNLLSPTIRIVGYALDDMTSEAFLAKLRGGVEKYGDGVDETVWKLVSANTTYVRGDFSNESMLRLAELTTGNTLFYLALPPAVFATAAIALGEAGLANETAGWRRLIIEKPFGTDVASSAELQNKLMTHWKENQLFRIDHFLGKDTVQNMVVFRLANRFIEAIWNNANIAQVQITASERLGVEGRWRYYDHAGALRDMLQNHLMQLFCLTAMEPPAVWEPEVLRDHKVEVLRSVRRISPEAALTESIRGQYGPGSGPDGPMVGYVEEPNIPPTSTTETYACLRLWVDNWRWQGVPFYLRSGKRMASNFTEIAIELRPAPSRLFAQSDGDGSGDPAKESPGVLTNWIVLRLRPDETIELHGFAKAAGLNMLTEPVVLSATDPAGTAQGEYSAYELLILDAIKGDHSLFIRGDEAAEAWAIVQPVLDSWAAPTAAPPVRYPAGSEGPPPPANLFANGAGWRKL